MTHDPHALDPRKGDGSAVAGKIVFHCANGHRIEVPASVAGKRGKCSKCGVEVQIPLPEGFVPPGAAAAVDHGGPPTQHLASPDPSSPPQSVDMFADLVAAAEERPSAPGLVDLALDALPIESPPIPPAMPGSGPGDNWSAPVATNPTAALVARLFQQVEHGGVVEVHITGGSVILPEFYDARWSGGSHGLFASRAADGSVTLTAVAWDAIQKIIVRQVEGLPDGMFD
jgi:hypothetical protein